MKKIIIMLGIAGMAAFSAQAQTQSTQLPTTSPAGNLNNTTSPSKIPAGAGTSTVQSPKYGSKYQSKQNPTNSGVNNMNTNATNPGTTNPNRNTGTTPNATAVPGK